MTHCLAGISRISTWILAQLAVCLLTLEPSSEKKCTVARITSCRSFHPAVLNPQRGSAGLESLAEPVRTQLTSPPVKGKLKR